MIEYGNLFGELHIILFSVATNNLVAGQLSPNVWAYPTNASNRFLHIVKAIGIGREILRRVYFGETAITTQDPFETGIVGAVLAKLFSVPLQIQLHTDAWSVHFQYGSFLNWFRTTILSRITLRCAGGVRVVTKKVATDVALKGKVSPHIISVLPVTIGETSALTLEPPVDLHVILLMVSRLEPEKNISLGLKVFKSIHARYPHAGLVIVGSGSQDGALRREVKRLSLSDSVSFEGFKLDTTSYFESADIFLNTSLYEGYGMTLIEAGKAGLPVVTTLVGVAHDLLESGRNALICPVGDANCLNNNLVNLVENPSLRRSLGEELKKAVETQLLSKEEYLRNMKASFDSLFS